jgi:hypothetical protein
MNLQEFLMMFMSGKKMLLIVATIFLSSCIPTDYIKEGIQCAYWAGQMDAVRGKIRVDKDTGDWIKLDSLMIEQGLNEYPKFIYGKSKRGIEVKKKLEQQNYFNK